MRKLVVTEFMSLDGVFEAPGPDGSGYKYAGWTFDYSSDAAMQFKYDELKVADTMLLGRITYEGFAKAWPNMQGAGDFGDRMNGYAKYVVSKTLQKADWQNSHIIKDNPIEEIKKLKEQDGQDILVAGSGELVRFLLDKQLVDQLNLLVYPVVLGEGKKLFDGADRVNLKLMESKAYDKSVMLLQYQVAE